jgi:hypothetical protein
MWHPSLFALLSLLTGPALALWTAPWKQPPAPVRSVQWLDAADVELSRLGLLHRHDVAIRVNDAEIARGYSRSGCDGLLLVAQLPNTAQGWHNVAPRIEFSKYELRYVYDGNVYETVPTLRKLRNWLVGTLPGRFEQRELVVGLAETGPCRLMTRALSVLDAHTSEVNKELSK